MLGVALRIGAALLLGLGRGVGGTGNTQVVLQFVACELQDTIQLVVMEVTGVESPGVGTTTLGVACAKAGPDAAVTATARMILNAVITASPRGESHHTAYWQMLAYGRSWTRPLLRHARPLPDGAEPIKVRRRRHAFCEYDGREPPPPAIVVAPSPPESPVRYGRSRDHHVEVQQVRDPMLNSSSP